MLVELVAGWKVRADGRRGFAERAGSSCASEVALLLGVVGMACRSRAFKMALLSGLAV